MARHDAGMAKISTTASMTAARRVMLRCAHHHRIVVKRRAALTRAARAAINRRPRTIAGVYSARVSNAAHINQRRLVTPARFRAQRNARAASIHKNRGMLMKKKNIIKHQYYNDNKCERMPMTITTTQWEAGMCGRQWAGDGGDRA